MSERHDSASAGQSDLDFDAAGALPLARSKRASLVSLFLRWLPVFVALALLAQIGIRGLKPALAEKRELAEKAEEVDERFYQTLERQRELELRLEAQDDPIYRERMRRLERREFVESQGDR